MARGNQLEAALAVLPDDALVPVRWVREMMGKLEVLDDEDLLVSLWVERCTRNLDPMPLSTRPDSKSW